MASLRNPYDSTDTTDYMDPNWANYSMQPDPTNVAGGGGQPEQMPVVAAPPQNPSAVGVGDPGNDMNAVHGYYSQFLGRPGTDAEVSAWLSGDAGDLGKIQNAIANSPEAQAYANQGTARQKVQPVPTTPQSNINPQSWFDQSPNPLPQSNPQHDAIYKQLMDLANSGGGFNQDVVNRRTEAAKETLDRQRQSTLKNDQAYLADRGLIGSGPESSALNYLDTNIGNAYKNQVSDIYANESQNADQRMMQALQLATGLNENDASDIINAYQAQTQRALGLGGLDTNMTLGLGNLALGNLNAANNYNLGLGQLGLQRDVAMNTNDNAQLQQILDLLNNLYQGANQSAKGYF